MIKRETYLRKLRQLKDQNLIKVITGIRRCGKSTLLEAFKDELLSDGVSSENIVFILISATKQKTLFWQKKSINMVNFERFSGNL